MVSVFFVFLEEFGNTSVPKKPVVIKKEVKRSAPGGQGL